VQGGRRHHQHNRNRHQNDGHEVGYPLGRRELLAECGIEDDNELKPKECLHPGQHGSALFENVRSGVVE
jgi:hypothetical protein